MPRTERLTREEDHGERSTGESAWLVRVGTATDPDRLPHVVSLEGRPRVVLGRDHPPWVSDPWLSGEHAEVALEGGVHVLRDLGSSNGTRLGGRPVSSAPLADGDLFETGGTFWRYFHREGPPPPAPTESEPLPSVSEPFRALVERARRLARTRVPLMLLGPTGVGKEVLARFVHESSGRTGAFVAIHAAAIQVNLLASELFGVERGAHSMAESARLGQVRAAAGGTLLFDEVGDMPAEVQVAILRLLQEGEVVPVGADRPVKVDVRIVCATHQDLGGRVQSGAFRADLFARLNGASLRVPPLAERPEDLGLLVRAFARRFSPSTEITFTPAAYRALLAYDWPLNVRELEKVMETAVALAERGRVQLEHLPDELRNARPAPPPASAERLEGEALKAELERLLTLYGGNLSAVARAIGKSRMQVHRYLERLGIDPNRFRGGG